MAKVSTADFRNGLNIIMDNQIYTIIEFLHVKPGKGPAFVRTKLKGVENGKTIDKTFRSGENMESVRIERREYQFLYRDGSMFYFMDQETFEQFPVEASRVKKQDFMIDGDSIQVVINTETEQVLYTEPADHINAVVEHTDPGVKGDTAQGGSKPATIASGATINVPLFINIGDKIRVDTRDASYIERVKE